MPSCSVLAELFLGYVRTLSLKKLREFMRNGLDTIRPFELVLWRRSGRHGEAVQAKAQLSIRAIEMVSEHTDYIDH